MVFAREIHVFDDHAAVLADEQRLTEMRENIRAGDCYIAKNVVPRATLEPVRAWLENIGRASIPNYAPIKQGAPNFHRMNRWDERAHVGGCFHQFVFFPWNDDPFDLFSMCRPIFEMKNRLSDLRADSFLAKEPEDGCTARLAFQFYPSGLGGLNRHADPVDYHQLTVPTMLLSKKGEDYQTGGAYVECEDGTRVDLDAMCDWGDVAYFNAQTIHGVERVDPGAESPWLDFNGRWMLLFAVNKLFDNAAIADAVDLED